MRTAARAAIVRSIALVVALTAPAQAQRGTIWVFGTGTKSCGQFLQAADGERKARARHAAPETMYTLEYLAFVTWTEGFLSGTNFSEHQWWALASVITLLAQWHGLKTIVTSTRLMAT
jgi:hypothetical protein